MAVLYSVSRVPMTSSSSGEKGRRSRSWRTERMACWDCQRQSFHWWSGTSRQSGWRRGLPGGSSSSNAPADLAAGGGSIPVRSLESLIVQGTSKTGKNRTPVSSVVSLGSFQLYGVRLMQRGCYRDVHELQDHLPPIQPA